MNTVLAQLLIVTMFSSLCRGGCPLLYVGQPPTMLSCSPYNQTSPDRQFTLRLVCGAIKNDSSEFIDSFELSWYRRRSSDGVEENLGPGNDKQENLNYVRIVLSGIMGLNLAPFSEEMPGEYWCQAVVTNSSGQYWTIESDVLMVLRPEDYGGRSVCSDAQYVTSQKCADASTMLRSDDSAGFGSVKEVETTEMQTVPPINEPAVSTSPVAQGNEMNVVLVYTLSAVAGFIVVVLVILLIAIAAIRYKGRKQPQGLKGIKFLHTLFSTSTDWNLSIGNVNPTMTDENLAMADSNLMMVDKNKDSSVKSAYYNNPQSQNFTKENPTQDYAAVDEDMSDVDTIAKDYQSINTTTMDYVSVYSRPDKGKDGDIIVQIKVGGNFYAVVDEHKVEQHMYTSLAN